MPDKRQKLSPATTVPDPLMHGGKELSRVLVDTYNVELRSADGFVGDRASKGAFESILEDWRERISALGDDPLGELKNPGKKDLDKALLQGDPEAAGLVHTAVEEFAQEFAAVIRRFMRLKDWKDTERIVIGGGLRQSRIGELTIGRAAVELKSRGCDVQLQPIRHLPDHAGLVGCMHLVPSWILAGHDSILAVDIGGSNIRAGIVEFDLKRADEPSTGAVSRLELWHHSGDAPKREEAIERLAKFLTDLIKRAAKDGLALAPFIGIGCPGVIREDGSIEKGGQNLPGNWEAKGFNLVERLREAIPTIADHDTVIVMHNDAVVQGLSELPWMQDVERWGVMTMGTGLGNARFTNRK
jgi:hypothetical protein